MKTIFTLFALFISLISFGQPHPVISQIYGGGGNAGAVYTNDFIELFNPADAEIDLSGWSVQYATATGSSWSVTSLNGSILPSHYYLIQLASGGANGSALPSPDATGTTNLSATAGKIALCNSTQPLTTTCATTAIDMVGYGSSATCYEGSHAAPAPSNTKSIMRANNGCTDSDSNDMDFVTATPASRNSSAPVNDCALSGIATPSSNSIKVFPNPAMNELWIMNDEFHNTNIQIVNILGETVLQYSGFGLPSILNISFLPPGYYMLMLSNEKAVSQSKFIKQ